MNSSVGSRPRVVRVTESRDLERCRELRKVVFIDEHAVPEFLERDDRDTVSDHFLATLDGVAVGTGRLRIEASFAKFERIAIVRHSRGAGLGRMLMDVMMESAAKAHPEFLPMLHAPERAFEFYRRLGWIEIGEPFRAADRPHRMFVYPPGPHRLSQLKLWSDPNVPEYVKAALRQ